MIYICADDYGMSKATCDRIESCLENGALDKISVLPNGKFADLKQHFLSSNVMLSLHINLVEGKPLSAPEKLSLLVSDKGHFKHTFISLFFLSLSKKRKELENQLYLEIEEQLRYWRDSLEKDAFIAIDSHQHTHMIPLIFKTLMRVIHEEKIPVGYLRYPTEPLSPYLLTPSLYLTYKPINIIKQWLLNILGIVNRKEFLKSQLNTAYFMGIMFSGRMDEKRVNKVLVHYLRLAEKHKQNIEILFHPGYVEDEDELLDKNKKSFNRFYFSQGRKTEFNTLINLKTKSNMKEACDNAIYPKRKG